MVIICKHNILDQHLMPGIQLRTLGHFLPRMLPRTVFEPFNPPFDAFLSRSNVLGIAEDSDSGFSYHSTNNESGRLTVMSYGPFPEFTSVTSSTLASFLPSSITIFGMGVTQWFSLPKEYNAVVGEMSHYIRLR